MTNRVGLRLLEKDDSPLLLEGAGGEGSSNNVNPRRTSRQLRWKKFPVLDDGFVCLVDIMGDDQAVVQAARVSYGRARGRSPTIAR